MCDLPSGRSDAIACETHGNPDIQDMLAAFPDNGSAWNRRTWPASMTSGGDRRVWGLHRGRQAARHSEVHGVPEDRAARWPARPAPAEPLDLPHQPDWRIAHPTGLFLARAGRSRRGRDSHGQSQGTTFRPVPDHLPEAATTNCMPEALGAFPAEYPGIALDLPTTSRRHHRGSHRLSRPGRHGIRAKSHPAPRLLDPADAPALCQQRRLHPQPGSLLGHRSRMQDARAVWRWSGGDGICRRRPAAAMASGTMGYLLQMAIARRHRPSAGRHVLSRLGVAVC